MGVNLRELEWDPLVVSRSTGLLTEEQCKSKRQRKMMRKAQAQAGMSPQQSEDESPILTDEQREIIERLVTAHKDLEVPGPEDLKSLTVRHQSLQKLFALGKDISLISLWNFSFA